MDQCGSRRRERRRWISGPGRTENGQGDGGKILTFQHEELEGRVVGEKEDGCGMGDQPGPLPLVRTHSPSPSIIYSK